MVGPSVIWPAKAGMDFPKQEGRITFDVGHRNTSLDIYLTPELASSLPTPKRFQVELYGATGGARVHPQFGLANVTLVSNAASEAVWVLLEQLHQPLGPTLLNQVLQGLINKVTTPLTREQMTAVLELLGKVRGLQRIFRSKTFPLKKEQIKQCDMIEYLINLKFSLLPDRIKIITDRRYPWINGYIIFCKLSAYLVKICLIVLLI